MSFALSIKDLLRLHKGLRSLLIRHLMHSIIAEVLVQFQVFVLVTLRVEGKTSLTEVEIDTVTTLFAPAVLANVRVA